MANPKVKCPHCKGLVEDGGTIGFVCERTCPHCHKEFYWDRMALGPYKKKETSSSSSGSNNSSSSNTVNVVDTTQVELKKLELKQKQLELDRERQKEVDESDAKTWAWIDQNRKLAGGIAAVVILFFIYFFYSANSDTAERNKKAEASVEIHLDLEKKEVEIRKLLSVGKFTEAEPLVLELIHKDSESLCKDCKTDGFNQPDFSKYWTYKRNCYKAAVEKKMTTPECKYVAKKVLGL